MALSRLSQHHPWSTRVSRSRPVIKIADQASPHIYVWADVGSSTFYLVILWNGKESSDWKPTSRLEAWPKRARQGSLCRSPHNPAVPFHANGSDRDSLACWRLDRSMGDASDKCLLPRHVISYVVSAVMFRLPVDNLFLPDCLCFEIWASV